MSHLSPLIKTWRVLLLALAMAAMLVTAAPRPAAADQATPAAKAERVTQTTTPLDLKAANKTVSRTAQATWYCYWVKSATRVDADCTVYSGYVRMWGYCSNGYYYFTPWVGVGRWLLWVDCGGYQLLNHGFQSAG